MHAAQRTSGVVEWGSDRAAELLDLVDVAYPDDRLTRDELVETITHLAFYAGWPNAMNTI